LLKWSPLTISLLEMRIGHLFCWPGFVPRCREALANDDTWTAPPDTSEGYGQGAIDLLSEWAAVARAETNGAGCTVPADAMLKVAQLLDAVYESSREGTRVAVDI
jgi:predicted dehydrogenase